MKLRIPSYLFLFFAVVFSFEKANGQAIIVPQEYLFYRGDTLKDFDFKEILDNGDVRSLSKHQLLICLHKLEDAFVLKKYNVQEQPIPQIFNANYKKDNSPLAGSPCNNADFEDGDYTNWTGYVGEYENSNIPLTNTSAGINTLGINSPETSCSWHTLVTTGTDPYGGFPMLDPGGGAYAVRLGGEDANVRYSYFNCGTAAMDPTHGGPFNNDTTGALGEVLEQSYAVTAANCMFTYRYAVVLNDGGHPNGAEPYFSRSEE